jgi:hypothetical protein
METPPPIPIHINALRTGNINSSCTTHATLVQDKRCLAQIEYELRGLQGIRQLHWANGPMAYQNDTFLARITQMKLDPTHNCCLALLTFAIKDLKELHEKQDKTGIQNHTLHIDAMVSPGSPESKAFEFFGFKKVSDWFANGFEQNIYLLDPLSVGQERTSLCQNYLTSVSSVTIEVKSDQEQSSSTEEENLYKKQLAEIDARNEAAIKNTSSNIQQLLDEQGKRTRGTRLKKSHPSHLPTSKPGFDPLKLGIPIPAAAAAPVHAAFPRLIPRVSEPATPTICQEELRKNALGKLRARKGGKAKLPRRELEAMIKKPGYSPITGISKKKDR